MGHQRTGAGVFGFEVTVVVLPTMVSPPCEEVIFSQRFRVRQLGKNPKTQGQLRKAKKR